MSKKYILTDRDIMAAALVDLLHITELAALLRDGDELNSQERAAMAAGITALADGAALRLADHVNGGTV